MDKKLALAANMQSTLGCWTASALIQKNSDISSAFNDTLSAIAIMRGDDFMEWDGQIQSAYGCFP